MLYPSGSFSSFFMSFHPGRKLPSDITHILSLKPCVAMCLRSFSDKSLHFHGPLCHSLSSSVLCLIWYLACCLPSHDTFSIFVSALVWLFSYASLALIFLEVTAWPRFVLPTTCDLTLNLSKVWPSSVFDCLCPRSSPCCLILPVFNMSRTNYPKSLSCWVKDSEWFYIIFVTHPLTQEPSWAWSVDNALIYHVLKFHFLS